MSVTLQSQPSGSRPLPRRMAFPHPARLSPAVVETIHAVKTSPIQASPVVTQVPTTPVKGPKFTITVEEAPDSALSLTEENPASVAVAIKRTGKKRVNQPRPYLGLRNKDGEPLPRKVDLCSIDRCRHRGGCSFQQSAWSPYCVFHTCTATLEDKTQCSGYVEFPKPDKRFCKGYHRENATFEIVQELQENAVRSQVRERQERQEEMDSVVAQFNKKYPIHNASDTITGPPAGLTSQFRGSFASTSSGGRTSSSSGAYSYEAFDNYFEDKDWDSCPMTSRCGPRPIIRSNASASGSGSGSGSRNLGYTIQHTRGFNDKAISSEMSRGNWRVYKNDIRSCPAPTRNPAFSQIENDKVTPASFAAFAV